MKKITLMLTFIMATVITSYAQVSINQSFPTTTTPAGWDIGSGGLSTSQACATASWRGNVYNATPRILRSESQISNGQDLTISFDYKIVNWSAATVATNPYNGTITTEVSVDGGTSWTVVAGVIDNSNHVVGNTCVNKSYLVPAASVPNGANIAVRWNCVFGTSGDYYVYLDNIIVNQPSLTPPSCASGLLPADIATNVERNPVLSWTAATGGPTAYDIYFGTSPTPPLYANTNNTTYTPTAPLLANTTYYWQVVPLNANGSATGCAIQSFTTGSSVLYCTPTTTFGCTDGDVIARVTLNTLDNDSGTGCPSGTAGYSDYTSDGALTTTLQAGSSYGCTVYAGQYSEGYAAWIDYNDDGFFDNVTERIGFSVGQVTGSGQVGVLGSSATFPIVLSCNPPLGQHRLRVRAMFNTNGSAVTPCTNNSYGEVEDYLITISAAVACPQPTGLSAANATTSSIELSWNVGCAETTWDLHVTTAGGGAPSGAPSHPNVNDNTSFLVNSGLTADTDYEFYVRAVCGGGNGESLWSGPFAFSTLPFAPECATLTTPANGATNVVLTATGTSFAWTAPVSGSAPEGYDVYLGTAPGTLTLLGNTTNLTEIITGLDYSTTYYWQVISVNAGGSATGCVEFSFTTQAAPPPPANDDCTGAIALTPGADFGANDIIGTNESATDSEIADPSIPDPGCASYSGGDVWYSAVVPASGSITFEVNEIAGNLTDTGGAVYSGSCGALILEDCDDLSSASGDHPLISLTARTPGEVLYFRVWEYSNDATGTFSVSAYDASLSTSSFNLEGFKAYPNPVKDVLNLSYTKEISKISVHNLLGQEVLSKSVNAMQSQVDLSRLSTGTYLVKVTVDGLENTIKIIKE